jgi:hypothetical protein
VRALALLWITAALAAQSQQGEESRAIPGQTLMSLRQSETEPLTVKDKWRRFVKETATPALLGEGAFNAAFSQALNTDPQYGVGAAAFGQRYGASVADIASQNFFGDFVLASALHEDPRYIRRGPAYGLWSRVGYALSRAVVIRKDAGGDTFNFSNVLGTAMSVGVSETYYPAPSRTNSAMAIRFGTNVASSGFANMLPEFWPDFKQWFKRKFH